MPSIAPTESVIDGPLESIARRTNSRDGNPRFTIFALGCSWPTEPDAQVNHVIAGMDHQALEGQRVRLTLRYHGGTPGFRVTGFEVLGNVAQSGQ